MTLSRVKLLYIGAVLVSGIVIGFIVRANPDWQHLAVPPAAWPFAVSLIVDLVIGQLAAQGKTEPLSMGDRFVAVIGAGIIVTLMTAF
ncbi:hypothetical protein MHY87_05630 [Microvirga sp. ACRRW]|uniref:hypothetical protein n=1 Tax=Microvirga sp. ACRRW TaxID=2918205 RepID=UPI001EF56D49|nr:hypothetical protein [Microvirga sp. ACRRW]MCG7392382.1 hypothetical protein [Microvirga sp. ACRRW]